jgi:hypothetical protein
MGARNWFYIAMYMYTHEHHVRNVLLTVSVDSTECNHEYPIRLDIANESGRALQQMRFVFSANGRETVRI